MVYVKGLVHYKTDVRIRGHKDLMPTRINFSSPQMVLTTALCIADLTQNNSFRQETLSGLDEIEISNLF